MAAGPQVWCLPVSGESSVKNTLTAVAFRAEEGKKSSFLLEVGKTVLDIPKPASLEISRGPLEMKGSQDSFFLGGFQIVSNSRNLEVFLRDKDGKEEYLTTSKGIPFEKGKTAIDWYKAVCVIPGGPRPVRGVQIKLLSLRPNGETTARVHLLKLTARLPEGTPTSASVPSPSPASQSMHLPLQSIPGVIQQTPSGTAQPPNSSSPAGITRQDLGAAMASLSIVARSTESAVEQALTEKIGSLERALNSKLARFEQHTLSLTSVIMAQKTILDQHKEIMSSQTTILQRQEKQIESLVTQQTTLTKTIQELQATVASLQHQRKGDSNSLTSILEQLKRMNTVKDAKRSDKTTLEDDPVEGGIEQTLSNLEMNNGSDDRNTASQVNAKSLSAATMNDSQHRSNDSDALAKVEKIEVSLMEGNQSAIQGLVHDNSDEPSASSVPESPSTVRLSKELAIATKDRSFESRNDKDEFKIVGALDKIDIELMTVPDTDTVAVIQDTNADENDRSPPDPAEGNLIDL